VDKQRRYGLIDSRFHECAIDNVNSRGQLGGFHFTCLFFYFGDLQMDDLRNWRHKKLKQTIYQLTGFIHVDIESYLQKEGSKKNLKLI